MVNELIRVDDPTSYPNSLLTTIENSKQFFMSVFSETFKCSKTYYENTCDFYNKLLNEHATILKDICKRIIDLEGSCFVEGFHLSRVFDINAYLKDGIQLLSVDSYCKRMDNVFRKFGFNDLERNNLIRILKEYPQSGGTGRVGRISLFYPASNYVLWEHERDGLVYYYAETVGGEYAKMAFSNDPNNASVLNQLQSQGEQVITKFRFQLNALYSGITEIPREFSISQLIHAYIYSQLYRKLPADFVFIAQIDKDVFPEDIISTTIID